jgi:hypothetical protein
MSDTLQLVVEVPNVQLLSGTTASDMVNVVDFFRLVLRALDAWSKSNFVVPY